METQDDPPVRKNPFFGKKFPGRPDETDEPSRTESSQPDMNDESASISGIEKHSEGLGDVTRAQPLADPFANDSDEDDDLMVAGTPAAGQSGAPSGGLQSSDPSGLADSVDTDPAENTPINDSSSIENDMSGPVDQEESGDQGAKARSDENDTTKSSDHDDRGYVGADPSEDTSSNEERAASYIFSRLSLHECDDISSGVQLTEPDFVLVSVGMGETKILVGESKRIVWGYALNFGWAEFATFHDPNTTSGLAVRKSQDVIGSLKNDAEAQACLADRITGRLVEILRETLAPDMTTYPVYTEISMLQMKLDVKLQ